MRKLLCYIAGLAAVFSVWSVPAYALTPTLDIISDTYCVMDAASGQVLIEKNMEKQKAPASITKILTVALALETGKLDDRFVLDYKTCHSIEPGSTHVALTEGEEISFRDAVMATMIMSANDGANAIAQYNAGSIDLFIPKMNQKLADIGAKNTHFVNPNGLDAKEHYTTAYDMCLITRYAMSVPGFNDAFGALTYTMKATNKQPKERPFNSRHNMLLKNMNYYYPGAVGGKLGYTFNARHTIVTTAQRDGMTLICVAMDSPSTYDKYKDSTKLLDYCFANFGSLTLKAKNIKNFDVPILNGQQQVGLVHIAASQDIGLVVSKGTQIKDLTFEYSVPASYAKGGEIAPTLTIYDKSHSPVYQGPLPYTVGQTASVTPQKIWKGQAQVYPIKEMALTALKWGGILLGSLGLFFFFLRFFVRRHYQKLREKQRQKRLEARRRQKLQPEASPSVPNNVTEWPGNKDYWSIEDWKK